MKAGIKIQCNNCGKVRNSTHMFSIHSKHGEKHYCGAKKCKKVWKNFIKRVKKEWPKESFEIHQGRIMECHW